MIAAKECLQEHGYHVVQAVLALASVDRLSTKRVFPLSTAARQKCADLLIQDFNAEGWLRCDTAGRNFSSGNTFSDHILAVEYPQAPIFQVVGSDMVSRPAGPLCMLAGLAISCMLRRPLSDIRASTKSAVAGQKL